MEIDDILLQALFRRGRSRIVSVIKSAEQRLRNAKNTPSAMIDDVHTHHNSNSSGKGKRSLEELIAEDLLRVIEEGSSQGVSSISMIEKFPIASAVRRATLAAMEMGAQAIMGSSYDHSSAIDDRSSRKSRVSSDLSPQLTPAAAAIVAADSDDDEDIDIIIA